MDFFHRLDNQQYAAFKMSMMNMWATTAVKQPKTPNEVYCLAGSWIKQPTRTESGYAITFVTIEEDARRTKKESEIQEKGRQSLKQEEGQAKIQTAVVKRRRKTYCAYSALSAGSLGIIQRQRYA
jgi:hypothetical protein